MEETNIYQVSKKRLALSWYIDLLFFMVLWNLLAFFAGFGEEIPFWAPYAAFVVIRLAMSRFLTPIGFLFLSIDKETLRVNRFIKNRESWLTILLGVLVTLEGTKQLVRWTQIFVPQPVFGFIPGETVQILMHLIFGGLSIIAGYWLLKLDIKGLFLAVAVAVLRIVSAALSWELWDAVVKEMVVERRAYQGLPLREGEIDFMQKLFPEMILVGAALLLLAMLLSFPRFRKASDNA